MILSFEVFRDAETNISILHSNPLKTLSSAGPKFASEYIQYTHFLNVEYIFDKVYYIHECDSQKQNKKSNKQKKNER